MGKNQSASNLTNIIKQDANGSIAFMSGSTMLMALSNTGQMSGSAPVMSAVTASYADNFLVKGNLTAQTLVVQTITSSVVYSSGSNVFGNNIANTQTFTGSVNITGSTNLAGSLKTNKIGINVSDLNLDNFSLGLIVSGAIGFANASGGAAALVDRDSSGNTTFYGSTGDIRFSDITLTSNYLTIKNAGNVGIGTSNPFSKLDVSTSTSQALCIGNNSDTITNGDLIGALSFVSRDASTFSSGGVTNIRSYAASTYNTGNVAADLRFYVSNGLQNTTAATLFGTEAMRISHEGKVGIGTINPSTLLQVAGLSTFGASNVNGDLTIISNGSPFAIRGRGDYDRPFLGLSWDTSPDTGVIYGNVLKFNTNTNWGTNAGTTALTILANGKVGIGETSPDNSYQGLTIKGTDPSLRIKTTSVSGWVWTEYVNSSGVNNFSMGVNQTAPYFGIKAGAGMDNVHFLMNSSGNIGMGEGANSIARLNVNGSTKINRSFYNWYQGYWTGNSTYWHMKTSMWGGGSPNGNTMYTMSLFKGYMYSYGDSAVREGMYGFHNWVGTIYNPGASGNLFSNVYVSSDGYVVLVIPSGSGEAGVTIDWHQAYAYPFVNAQVTAAGLHGSTTGKY
jgi:hypothetical protein